MLNSSVLLCRGMKPHEHYLPLDIDFHNLKDLVDWAKSNPSEAQIIADNAARYVEEEITNSAMECYGFRMVIEYNRLRRLHASRAEG